ncbi:Folylpolyglutamate synthetase [Elasticomyces elasticus]|nr:Folylpolyglutamate synthetase [Elasticomyces elasticus]
MLCKGIVLGSVISRTGSWQLEDDGEDFAWEEADRFLRDVEAMMAAQTVVPANLSGMSLERWLEGVWRIPIADEYEDGTGIRTRATSAAKEGWQAVKIGRAAVRMEAYALNGYQMAMSRLHGRRLARTREVLIGLMPADVEVGDVVSIIFGAEAPLLLRPESRGSAYKMVGESFVYGVMDGEAIANDTTFTDLDIC